MPLRDFLNLILVCNDIGPRYGRTLLDLEEKHGQAQWMMIVSIKKLKEQKKVRKRGLMFKSFTDCLFNDKIILKSQQRFKSDCRSVYTEQINKTALNSNDDKRLQTFKRIHAEQILLKYVKVRCSVKYK